MSPPKKAIENLPWYLKKRIKIDGGREDKACWCWTGKFRKERERWRAYAACERPEVREHFSRRIVEKGIPKVLHPVTKNERDAHRDVYSAVMGIQYDEVPTLQRCENPRCVSPHHVIPGAPTAAQRKRLNPRPEIGLELEIHTHERCMELLRAASGGEGVNWGTTKDEAADEAGIPRDQLTEECWAHYVREEMAKEDEENDDAD